MTEESLGTDVEVILGAPPCAESADSVSVVCSWNPTPGTCKGTLILRLTVSGLLI